MPRPMQNQLSDSLPARPMDDIHGGGLELSQIFPGLLVAFLCVICGITYANNNVDQRETAMAIDAARARLAMAQAEQERLQLELATLRDPETLRATSEQLGLYARPTVIDLPAEPVN